MMGTQARIVLYARDASVAAGAAQAAFERMAALEGIMSDYRPESELSGLCDAGGQGPTVVSDDLFQVLLLAQELSHRTDGAFDVTLGALTRLWREARRTGELPAAKDLESARELTGPGSIELDPEARAVRLTRAGVLIDLGGIGKGYACDAGLAALSAHGTPRALVELGGDFALGAPPPGRRGWTIATGCADAVRVLSLVDCGLATSGSTEQALDLDGVRYSHVLDPRTGLAATSTHCVTVQSHDAATADALASAGAARGPEIASALLARLQREGLVLHFELAEQ